MLEALQAFASIAALLWAMLLCVPWRPWRPGPCLEEPSLAEAAVAQAGLADRAISDSTQDCYRSVAKAPQSRPLTVLIPARNEASIIGDTIEALAQQQAQCVHIDTILVIDDHSDDATAAQAQVAAQHCDHFVLRVLSAAALPAGWSGKLWALECGLKQVRSDWVLLLDADIQLSQGTLEQLARRLDQQGGGMVSVMATLPVGSFWERLLHPPFVYFFKLIYPFELANRARSKTAAAAGGCMLIERHWLREVNAFSSIGDALIDDCALARVLKRQGAPTWLGLARGVVSGRRGSSLRSIVNMVARNAYTQLGYSFALLLLCSLAMVVCFVCPIAAVFVGYLFADWILLGLGAAGTSLMLLSYWPMVRFYLLPGWWSAMLPLAALVYLSSTWLSAWRFWRGTKSQWKGRRYDVGTERSCDEN